MILNGRDVELLTWLVHMKFMTLDQIGRAFFKGSNPRRSPYRRILKLMKEGYIQKKKVYIESKDVYMPTRKAVLVLKQGSSRFAMNLSKDKYLANYEHDRVLIDLRILFKDLGIETWVPERVIKSIKPRGSCPDALLITAQAGYAIEYERTEKKLTRYKEILRRYDFRESYDHVLYICASDSMIERIQDKFHPSNKFYFLNIDDLFDQRENATFFSRSDGLPVKELIKESSEMDLQHLDPSFVEHFVKPKLPDESWKKRKPFIPIPKPRRDDQENEYESEYAKDYYGHSDGDSVDAIENPQSSGNVDDWDQHDN